MSNYQIFEFESTDSTNLRAREYVLNNGVLPALFIAEEQTNGKGRRGRSFYSPKSTGLYMTLAVSFDKRLTDSVSLTCAVAVATKRVLSDYTNKKLTIKWVNDILADSAKVAGILCETITEPQTGDIKAIIIGIGVNLTTKHFPKDIAQSVTSLSDMPIDRKNMAYQLADGITKVLYLEEPSKVIEEYRVSSAVIGKDICFFKNGEKTDAKAIGIDELGGLKVLLSDGTFETLRSGEITLRIKPE